MLSSGMGVMGRFNCSLPLPAPYPTEAYIIVFLYYFPCTCWHYSSLSSFCKATLNTFQEGNIYSFQYIAFINGWAQANNGGHNSTIYDYQMKPAKVLTMLQNQAHSHQDDSNSTPAPICEFQVDFPLLWIKVYHGLSYRLSQSLFKSTKLLIETFLKISRLRR